MTDITSLGKDIIEKITNDVSPADFINFCSVYDNSKSVSKANLCSSDMWNRRFQKDFNFLIPYLSEKQKQNIKKTYLDIFISYTQTIEKIYDKVMKWIFGNMKNLLSKKYKIEFFNYFYMLFEKNFSKYLNTLKGNNLPDTFFDYDEYKNFKDKFLPEGINFQLPMQNHISSDLKRFFENLENHLDILKLEHKERIRKIIFGNRKN